MATEEYKGPDTSFVEAQVKAEVEARLKGFSHYLDARAQLERKHEIQALQDRYNEAIKGNKGIAEAAEELHKARIALEKEYFEIQSKNYENLFKTANILEQKRLSDKRAQEILEHRERLRQLDAEAAKEESILNAHNQAMSNSIQAEIRLRQSKWNIAKQTVGARAAEQASLKQDIQSNLSKKQELEAQIDASGGAAANPELVAQLEKIAELINQQVQLAETQEKEARKDRAKKTAQDKIQTQLEGREQHKEDARAELMARFGTKDGLKNEGAKALENSMKAMQAALDNGLKEIDSKINSFYEMQAKMEARLQGATYRNEKDELEQISYERLLKNMSQTVGFSGLVKQTDIAKNIQGFIEAGVAYNIEGRAFLATIADSVASTFDAKNPDLLRLIRLQQQDTTAARLGLEASLTRLFNEYFSDTSYLAQAFDSVSSSLVDVSSMLSRNDSIEFEYIVQKWLGSLTALGLSENAATTIAQGLNYLGTGNVSALNSNSALQTLFAMSSGGSYADILTHGLTAQSTNDLLRNMVVYLKNIADGTNTNLVVKSAYSELLGLGVSDLAAISNLTETEIENLYNKSETYDKLITETQNQLNQVSSRIHISQLLTNIMDNALTRTATGIGGTPGLYGMWKAANIVEGLTGGIDIPSIMTLGTGVDLNTTVTRLLKTGIAGASLIGQLVGSLTSERSGGALNLDSWKISDATVRGVPRKALTMGSLVGVSQSSGLRFVSSGSGGDIQDSTLLGGAENAEKTGQIINSPVNKEETVIDKIYKSIGEQQEGTNILQQLIGVNENVSRITQLISAGADLEQIQSQAASNIAQGSALSGNLSNSNKTGLGVIVNGLSEETKKYIEHIVRVTLAGMIVGDSNIGENGENTSLPEKLVQLLSTSTIPVNITNDWFDDAIQRSAFN